jgi:hypothetical protein
MSNFSNYNDSRMPLGKQVRAVATSNLASTGEQTIDGVSIVVGDPVLLAGQTNKEENGLFVVAPNHWQRLWSGKVASEYRHGMLIHVSEGTTYGGTVWRLATAGPYTLGTTELTFEQSAAGSPELTSNDPDTFVNAAIAVADATGGATATSLAVTLTRLDGSAVTKACTVLIYASTVQYGNGSAPNANVTLDTVGDGSIVASVAAAGYFVVKTDTDGSFTCNANNSTDETVWFNVGSPLGGIDALAAGTYVRGCVPDSAAWSA